MIDKEKILALAAEELADANTKHPPTFNSMHEAYAVIKEEFEELKNEVDYMEFYLVKLWERVKEDSDTTGFCKMLKNAAISAVQEAIQVIAMCDKALQGTQK